MEALALDLTDDQKRLLCILYLYTGPHMEEEKSKGKDKTWLKDFSLRALISYLVEKGFFKTYDLAPSICEVIGHRRYVKLSYEAEDDIHDLREKNLIIRLKLSTTVGFEYCYRITDIEDLREMGIEGESGVEVVEGLKDFFSECCSFLKCCGEPKKIHLEDRKCILRCSICGKEETVPFFAISNIPYESSFFIPLKAVESFYEDRLIYFKRMNSVEKGGLKTSASLKIPGSRKWKENEYLCISPPKILMFEWIPFGTNHILEFSSELGCLSELGTVFLSDIRDNYPYKSIITHPKVYTVVAPVGFNLYDCVLFDSVLKYPSGGIKQVERVSTVVDLSGCIIYATELLNANNEVLPSLDSLVYVLSDLNQDTTKMMATLLSSFQRRAVGFVYPFAPEKIRDKYVIIITRRLFAKPKGVKGGETKLFSPGDAWEFADDEEYQNEINQVIGQTFHKQYGRDNPSFIDIEENVKVFQGEYGAIIVLGFEKGDRAEKFKEVTSGFEKVAVLLGFTRSIHIFQTNLFRRLWVFWEKVRYRRVLTKEETSKLMEDVELVKSICHYLFLAERRINTYLVTLKKDLTVKGILEKLSGKVSLEEEIDEIRHRTKDLEKIASDFADYIEAISSSIGTELAEKQVFSQYLGVYLAMIIFIVSILPFGWHLQIAGAVVAAVILLIIYKKSRNFLVIYKKLRKLLKWRKGHKS